MQAAKKHKPMTPKEAQAGINQRVTDCKTGEVGTLQSVDATRRYNLAFVAFDRGVRRVMLRDLTWTDGLRTTHTVALPYSEFIHFFYFSSAEQRGSAEMRTRFFKLSFGRAPTANERHYMGGKSEAGVCKACRYPIRLAVNPNGSVDSVCECDPSDAATESGG